MTDARVVCPVEAVPRPRRRRLRESSTGQRQLQLSPRRQSLVLKLSTTSPIHVSFKTVYHRGRTIGFIWPCVLYLEPFVGFPGRRLLEASPSSLGSNPGGPPSWNERAPGPHCCCRLQLVLRRFLHACREGQALCGVARNQSGNYTIPSSISCHKRYRHNICLRGFLSDNKQSDVYGTVTFEVSYGLLDSL